MWLDSAKALLSVIVFIDSFVSFSCLLYAAQLIGLCSKNIVAFGRHPSKPDQNIIFKITLVWRYNSQIKPEWDDTFTPPHIGRYLIASQLEAWDKEVTRPTIKPKYFYFYQLCTFYSRASCYRQNLHTLLTVFRNNSFMLQKYKYYASITPDAPCQI